jgi:hypothetical protein
VLTEKGSPTDFEFYVQVEGETLKSQGGVLVIDNAKLDKYRNAIAKLRFVNPSVFDKVYKTPAVASSDATTLQNLCGVIRLQRKN